MVPTYSSSQEREQKCQIKVINMMAPNVLQMKSGSQMNWINIEWSIKQTSSRFQVEGPVPFNDMVLNNGRNFGWVKCSWWKAMRWSCWWSRCAQDVALWLAILWKAICYVPNMAKLFQCSNDLHMIEVSRWDRSSSQLWPHCKYRGKIQINILNVQGMMMCL